MDPHLLRPGEPEEAGMAAARVCDIARRAEQWVEAGLTPALVILAARRGTIVLHEAFGRLTPDPTALPLPGDAIFPLASITKVITATAAMLLVEDGLLGLNRPTCGEALRPCAWACAACGSRHESVALAQRGEVDCETTANACTCDDARNPQGCCNTGSSTPWIPWGAPSTSPPVLKVLPGLIVVRRRR